MENVTTKEIENQFETWLKIPEILINKKQLINSKKNFIDDETIVVFTGAGTSGYIGDMLEKYLNAGKERINFVSYYTTEIVSNPKLLLNNKKILLVSFARSGNSPESIETINLCNQYSKSVEHLIITCNDEGILYQEYSEDSILLPKETNDQGFAMTNSFSSMMITAAKIFDLQFDIVDVSKKAKKLYDVFPYEKITNNDFENIIYLSNTENIGLLKELTLKCMELTNGKIGCYCEQFLNFRHGPKSLITKKSLIIGITSTDTLTQKYEKDLYQELIEDENRPLIVILGQNQKESLISCQIDAEGFSRALIIIPVCQQIAVNQSLKFNLNPDNPSPSGSVNRVVKGVKIYKEKIC